MKSTATKIAFAAALAVSDTVAAFASGHDVKVKWPNDVLVDGRKIAGILLESASTGATRFAVTRVASSDSVVCASST